MHVHGKTLHGRPSPCHVTTYVTGAFFLWPMFCFLAKFCQFLTRKLGFFSSVNLTKFDIFFDNAITGVFFLIFFNNENLTMECMS